MRPRVGLGPFRYLRRGGTLGRPAQLCPIPGRAGQCPAPTKGRGASAYTVGAAHRAARPKWIGGRPLDLPHPIPEDFLRTVGEGLKVNRPKAERSHPGVCPSRGPVWDRPLRKDRYVSTSAVGAGVLTRPLWRWAPFVGCGLPDAPFHLHAKRRRGGPRGRPCRMQNQVSIPFVGAAHRAARERPDEDIGPYEKNAALPVFAVSLSRT